MPAVRSLLLGALWAAAWPLYLAAAAWAARLGPWPRATGTLAATVLNALALAMFVRGLGAWFFKPDGWCERYLATPSSVTRQFRHAGRLMVLSALFLLTPVYLFANGEIAFQGTAVTAPALSRFLYLAFEVIALTTLIFHLRPGSPLMTWINPELPTPDGDAPAADPAGVIVAPSRPSLGTVGEAWVTWCRNRARLIARLMTAFGAVVVFLDVRGYGFAASRLAIGGVESLAVFLFSWAIHRAVARLVVWRLRTDSPTNRLWTSAAAIWTARAKGARAAATAPGAKPAEPVDWGRRLERVSTFTILLLAVSMLGWIWGIDSSLLGFLARQPLPWSGADDDPVMLGDLALSLSAVATGVFSWRFMPAILALTVFRRVPDDPGVRYAVVSLARYAVMAAACAVALRAIHFDLSQISFLLAALGVGLGFGLQEVVSNFICGLILLLERPIRIGDTVSVGGTTGKVDRINTRATTIINGDNQCMIVPNRELITGRIVNWTHKDKIMRVPIRVVVAHDSDVEAVTSLLLAIAKSDFDVLSRPTPSASLEELGESGMIFGASVFVADPGLMGGAKHRIYKAIRERFAQAGIAIASPTRAITFPEELTRLLDDRRTRGDEPEPTPRGPHHAEAMVS